MTIIITKVEKNLSKVTILIVYSLIAFYFLINGEGLFSTWETNWTFNAIIYILGVTLFLGVIDELPRELKTPLWLNVKTFAIASTVTLVVLLIVKDFGIMFVNISPMPSHLIIPNLTFQLVIVSCSEEIIFRGVIFGYLYDRFKLRGEKTYGWLIPYLGSALVFMLFHLAVYGFNLVNLFIVFMMGIIFAYCAERWGIGSSIGVHWIWNCMALGVFSLPSLI